MLQLGRRAATFKSEIGTEIFENVRQCIEFEIDSDDSEAGEETHWKEWRRLVLAALADDNTERATSPEDRPPEADCSDMDEWSMLIEIIGGRVLWDDDWLDEDLHMDVSPETSRLRKEHLCIDDNYYTAIAPDPTEAELIEIRRRLKRLLES